ncbi:MAG TPA: amino acid permease, partial [Candidatus Saccharimonadia bacterium]|nr:amino acid permease [Candidatus Saccharimonadia bacterium]
WAFLGLESATVPAQAVRDPARNVPRATWLGTVIAAAVTVLACTVVIALVPAASLADSGAPFADAARLLWGDAAARAFAAAGAIACFGALNGWVLMQGQLPAAIARDGLFPAAFARENANGAPALALLASTAIATLLIVARSQASLVALFTASILISTAATLVPYLVCSLGTLALARAAGRRALAVTALLAFAYSLWAIVGTGTEALLWCAGAALAGLVVYRLRPGRV